MNAITLTNDNTGDFTPTNNSHDGSLLTYDELFLDPDWDNWSDRKSIRYGLGGTKWIKRIRARFTPDIGGVYSNLCFYQKGVTDPDLVSGAVLFSDYPSGYAKKNEGGVMSDMDITFQSPVEADKIELHFWCNGVDEVNIDLFEVEAWEEESPNQGLLKIPLHASDDGTIESTPDSFDNNIETYDGVEVSEISTESIQYDFKDSLGNISTRKLSRIELAMRYYQNNGMANVGSPVVISLYYIPPGETGTPENYVLIEDYSMNDKFSGFGINVARALDSVVDADGILLSVYFDGDMGDPHVDARIQEVEAWEEKDWTPQVIEVIQ